MSEQPVVVTQEAREAAAALIAARPLVENPDIIMYGGADDGGFVQAFARFEHEIRLSTLSEKTKAVEEAWHTVDDPDTPAACHVLAARFDDDAGEWVVGVVMSPPSKPFTHWRMLPEMPAIRSRKSGG
jgi:hypothetical protein